MTKKLSIFITTFVLIFGVQFAQPKKAYAIFGIGDISYDIPTLIKEFGIDTLVTILQNRVLNKLIDDTINWANGGFDGEPGFINNWDGFLEGTKHDLLANTFNLASNVAGEAASQYQAGGVAYNQCISDNFQKALAAEDAFYDACMISNSCELIDLEDETCEDICIEESGIEYDKVMQVCNNQSNLYSDLGNVAQQNYNNYMNGNLVSTRSVALAVANFGAKELNLDPVNSLINGEGNTLTYLLGSQAAVDTFGSDITRGGWTAYMALSDPHNYPSGLNSLITGALGSKTEQTVKSTVESMQTPQKYEDKRKCIEWGTQEARTSGSGEVTYSWVQNPETGLMEKIQNADTSTYKESKICVRYETQTPGSLIEGKVKKALTKDEDQSYLARELSDVLAKALGRLTDGLLQAGLNQISKKKNNSGNAIDVKENDNVFASTYQNQYDVLGIADDALIFNQEANEAANEDSEGNQNLNNILNGYTQTVGGDGSTPYVGGPEDREGVDWNEGPELIVELKGNLEKALDLTQKVLNYHLAIKSTFNKINDQIITLDHCLPGPDYGWEQRYNDKAQANIGKIKQKKIQKKEKCSDFRDELQQEYFDVGLPLTKEMINDDALNIPGAGQISSIIKAILGEDSKKQIDRAEGEIKNKRNLLNTLLFMKTEAATQPEFIAARDAIDSRIPLFTDEIYEKTEDENGEIIKVPILTDQDLIDILSIQIENDNIDTSADNPFTYMIESEGLYVFKEKKLTALKQNTKDVDVIVETPTSLVKNNRKRAEEVIIDWGWKIWRRSVNPKEKSKLRYQYHIIKNDISTEKDVLEMKIKFKEAKSNSDRVISYAEDCPVFLENMSEKTNIEAKALLEEEYNKQQSYEESLFKTDLFTSPANIAISILKFKNRDEVNEYIDNMYGEDVRRRFTSISSVIEYGIEKVVGQFKIAPLLFCQADEPDGVEGCGSKVRPNKFTLLCDKDWAVANEVDYKAAFAGI